MENVQKPSTSRARPVTSRGRKAHRPNIPCRGLCKRKRHYNQVIEIAYTFMAAVRNSLPDGLLLTFVNATRDDVDLIWQDYEGEEIRIIKFKPGDQYRISAVTGHDFCCRNTKTGRHYLLNSHKILYGHELKGAKKSHTIQMTVPRTALTLREVALSVAASCLKDKLSALELPVPLSVQTELCLANRPREGSEYYSINGEPGVYRKSYGDRDEGPWIYPPGMDWTSFEE